MAQSPAVTVERTIADLIAAVEDDDLPSFMITALKLRDAELLEGLDEGRYRLEAREIQPRGR